MGDIGKWLDSIGAPRYNERGWAYTEIGRIEAYIEEGKQALEQRLIDAVNDLPSTLPPNGFDTILFYSEIIEAIEKVFSDK